MKVSLTSSELRVMEEFWRSGRLSIREVLESYPAKKRPPYTSVQGTVNRLEEKGALRRARKIGNAHVYEAVISAQEAKSRVLDDLLRVFGGRAQTVMAHLAESGQLTREDMRQTEKLIEELERRGRLEEKQ
ncbi:MAG TPA: BlaI/MecI/CopY family transcriptional regulator [Terriglobales bacterium]|nr:BlaI/MecI/CopY family transcriptional regulator [Terriglobales bacterium]